jgi:hypothetical protein
MLSLPFELSTHQHPVGRHRSGRASSNLEGGGCCASTKTGYSVGFVARSTSLVFHIHSWRGGECNSQMFGQFLVKALLDMLDLVQM